VLYKPKGRVANKDLKMKNVLTREVVDRIRLLLGDSSHKIIARYIGVSTVALSQNIERPFKEILDNKVGKRLDSLLFLLECVRNDESLDIPIIHRLLTLPAFKDKDGWKVDVVSAIHEEYDKSMLIEVFQKAIEVLRKPVEKTPVKNSLYSEIHVMEA
jgi:hypothetical protein